MDISSTSSSSDEEMIVLLNEERRRKRRRYWIHPIVTRREEHGEFYRLVQELKMYHARFRGYFRMSVSEFEHLLQQLAPSLTKEHTHYRKPIDPEQRLAVCLRWVRLHWYSLQNINEALLKTSICLFQFSKHWGLVPHYCVQLSTWCVNCGFDSEWDLWCIVALPQRWTFASAYWRDVEEYSQEVPWKMEFP